MIKHKTHSNKAQTRAFVFKEKDESVTKTCSNCGKKFVARNIYYFICDSCKERCEFNGYVTHGLSENIL